MSSTNNWR